VDKLLNLSDAAKILGKGERTMRNLCLKAARGEQGGIKSAKIGRDWRIKEKDLEEFIQSYYPAQKTKRQRG
jgi:excisionase family DNA binding protein